MKSEHLNYEKEHSELKFAVAIFTRNEESNIIQCIESAQGLGKVFVIDSGSIDRTVELAVSCGAAVIEFNWNGDYPRKKQWTLQQLAHFDRVVMLDADLRMTKDLIEEIKQKVTKEVNSALCPIRYFFMEKEIKHGIRVYFSAVLNPKTCYFPNVELPGDGYGDIEFHYQPICKTRPVKLKSGIIHDDNDPLSSWVSRHIRYAEYEAKLTYFKSDATEYIRNKTLRGRCFHFLPFKASIRFLVSYFGLLGFLDGPKGFRYQYMLSHHYYLSRIFIDDLKLRTKTKI